jgi:hypothetical protein
MSSLRVSRAIVLILVLSLVLNSCKKDEPPVNDDTAQIINDAYIYAYPLISMKITANVATNVVHTTDRGYAPYNQFSHRNEIPDYSFTSVVSPNVDTFYSSGWLDLDEEPMVLFVPDATLYKPDNAPWRYYVIQMMDTWSNVFAAPGVRTTGTEARSFLISGPNWSGSVPGEMTQYISPTRLVWVLVRTMVKGADDVETVEAFQNGMSLMPLSVWPGPYNAPDGVINSNIDMTTAPVDQVAELQVEAYFQMLCDLMVDNPASSYDMAMVQKLAQVGITPGGEFKLSDYSESEQSAIKAGYADGQLELANLANTVHRIVENGWSYMLDNVGDFQDHYDLRAYVANVGLGANLPQDGVYPFTPYDITNEPLNTAYKYTITFPPGETPPARGFWSLTMYTADHFLAQNPINRYAIGSYMDYQLNEDSSLTLYIQKDSTGIEKMSNWLPTPQHANSGFNLMLRIYWPEQKVLDNQWEVPGVVKVN